MYRLNEDQRALLGKFKGIAEKQIAVHAAEVDREGRFPRQAIDALAATGFLGLTVPAEFGGLGQGMRLACAVLEEMALDCASTAMVYKMHLCACAAYAGAPEPAAEILREVAAGHHLSTLAWSEQGSRSHFWVPVSQAVQNNGQVALNAKKSWVTSAGEADGYVVSTRSPGATHPTQSVLYLVLQTDPGVRVSGPWNGLGMRGNASAPMMLEDCRIPASRGLCEPGKGLDFMLGVVMPWFQLGNAAVSVGIAEAATRATQAHLTGKRMDHLNSPLADFPTLRARLAQMRTETDMARAYLASAIDAVENPGPQTMLLVLGVKAAAAEAALRVTDLAMKSCGGAAFSRHLSVERHFRDARAASVMAPTSDVIYEFIGRALCGMQLF